MVSKFFYFCYFIGYRSRILFLTTKSTKFSTDETDVSDMFVLKPKILVLKPNNIL